MVRKFTADHEWVDIQDDIAAVGVTSYAQGQLGDIVFVEMPSIGKKVSKGSPVALIESVKAASEIYAPIDGEVVAVNEELTAEPGRINSDADTTWIFRVRVRDGVDLKDLLGKAEYDQLIS